MRKVWVGGRGLACREEGQRLVVRREPEARERGPVLRFMGREQG